MAWEDRQDMEKAVRDEQERVLAEAREKAYRDPDRERIEELRRRHLEEEQRRRQLEEEQHRRRLEEELRRRYLEAEGKGTDDGRA